MEHVQEYLPMLKSIAWKFSQRSNIEYDDAYGEACLIAVKAIKKYDSAKGKLSTFLYAAVQHRLINYAKKQKKLLQEYEEVNSQRPDASVLFLSKLQELNRPSKQVCDLIFSDPEKFMRMSQSALTEHLRELDWDWKTIRQSYQQIKKALN